MEGLTEQQAAKGPSEAYKKAGRGLFIRALSSSTEIRLYEPEY